MAINLGDAILYASADFSGMTKDLASASQAVSKQLDGTVDQVKSKMTVMSDHARKIGDGMMLVGGAIAGSLGVAVKGAVSYGDNLAKLSTKGVKDIDKISESTKELAVEFKQDLNSAINATYVALTKGISEKNLPEFMTEAAKAAEAGMTDLNTTVELSATIVNTFGTDAKRALNDVVIASQDGGVKFEALAGAVGKVAPTFKAAGLGVDELVAAVTALSVQGIDADTAVAGLKTGIGKIILPGKQAQALSEALGIQMGAAGLKAKGLAGWLQDVSEKTQGNVPQMAALVGGIRPLNTMLALVSDKGMATYSRAIQRMKTDTNATQKALDALDNSKPGEIWEQLGISMQVMSVNIGEALLPQLKDLGKWLLNTSTAVMKFTKENKETTTTIVKVAGVLAGLAIVAKPLGMTFGALSTTWGLLSSSATALSAASGMAGLAGVFAAGGALVVGLGVTATAVGMVGYNIYKLIEAMNGARKAAEQEPEAYYKIAHALNEAGVEYDHTYASSLSMGDALIYLQSVYEDHRKGINSTKEALVAANKKMREDQANTTKSIGDGLSTSTSLWGSWSRYICNYIEDVGKWAVWAWEKLKQLLGIQTKIGGGGIPAFASGGYVTSPALHQTIFAGEEGPELAEFPNGRRALLTAGMYNVPTGTYINDAASTAARLGRSGRAGTSVNVNINLSGNLRNNDDVARISRSIARQVRTSLVGAI